MPFKTDKHANLGYVDKEYKEMLDKICAADKRSIKDELEFIIHNMYNNYIANKVVDK